MQSVNRENYYEQQNRQAWRNWPTRRAASYHVSYVDLTISRKIFMQIFLDKKYTGVSLGQGRYPWFRLLDSNLAKI